MHYLKGYNCFEAVTYSSGLNTMDFWHGGNLDASVQYKTGRYEYGPGLYMTTHYDTAMKYAKGSRKLYLITVERGTDIDDVSIPHKDALEFISEYVPMSKRKYIDSRFVKFMDDGKIPASVLNNILINESAIKPGDASEYREFLIGSGVDYQMVRNAFGWNETMMVLYNMDKIIQKQQVRTSDNIEIYDLPSKF